MLYKKRLDGIMKKKVLRDNDSAIYVNMHVVEELKKGYRYD